MYDITTDGDGYAGIGIGPAPAGYVEKNFAVKSSNTDYTVYATPKAGWTFVNWTQNGKVVSTSAKATFKRSKTNKLVAHFAKGSFIGVESVSLPKTLTLTCGKTSTLKPTFNPANATDKRVTWSSSKTGIATVSSAGIVAAVKAGTATITVKTANGKTASCVVTVKPIDVKTIKLNKATLTLKLKKTYTLKPIFTPANATDKRVTWIRSNKKIVTVNSKGVVKALKKGKVTITVKASNGKTAKCVVTVK